MNTPRFTKQNLYSLLTLFVAVIGLVATLHLEKFQFAPKAEALMMRIDGDTCDTSMNECATSADCDQTYPSACKVHTYGTCPVRTCDLIPNCTNKNCGPDGAGGLCSGASGDAASDALKDGKGGCLNGNTCNTNGQCGPMSPYCPRTDNALVLGSLNFVPSADVTGLSKITLTSNSSACPIGSLTAAIPCSADNANATACSARGCTFVPAYGSSCNLDVSEVTCSSFRNSTACNAPANMDLCKWEVVSTGPTGPQLPAAVGLAAAPVGGAEKGLCVTNDLAAQECSGLGESACKAKTSAPKCAWTPPVASQCIGTPSYKTSSLVTIGSAVPTKIYERIVYAVTNYYHSCSFWRCTTKYSSDVKYLEGRGSCVVGASCPWGDRCQIATCDIVGSATAEVTATPQASPKGWKLSVGPTNLAPITDPTLLNACWGSNPDGKFIAAPGCIPPVDGGWSGWTCVNGVQKRTCTNPAPAGGKDCVGSDTGASCVAPVDSACINTSPTPACTNTDKGATLSNVVIGTTSNTWDCVGVGGGANQYGCEYKKRVDAECGPTHNNFGGCLKGTQPLPYVTLSDRYTWGCSGANGGVDVACVEYKPIDGVCKLSTPYSCVEGSTVSNSSNPDDWTWKCLGSYGGSDSPQCLKAKPSPNAPVITGPSEGNVNTIYSFTFSATNPSGDDVKYAIDWDNNGSVDQYVPFSGLMKEGIATVPIPNQWGGVGVKTFAVQTQTAGTLKSGWTTHNITIQGAPDITWSPISPVTIDYDTPFTLSYNTAGAVSCDLSAVDGSTVTPMLYSAPSNYAWPPSMTLPAGRYQANFQRRLTCYNKFGAAATSDFMATVRQNDATCVSVDIPPVVEPHERFTATIVVRNSGSNTWKQGSVVLGSAIADSSFWGPSRMTLQDASVDPGNNGTFVETNFRTANGVAIGDYPFKWGALFLPAVGLPIPFGAEVCEPSTKTIHVQPATVSAPALLDFGSIALKDSRVIKPLNISNIGGGTLTATVSPVGGDWDNFTCKNGLPCTFLIGPGKTIPVDFTYGGNAIGSSMVMFKIEAEGPPPLKNKSVAMVNFRGEIIDKFKVTATPSQFGDAPTTRTKYLTLTIKNFSNEKDEDGIPGPGNLPLILSAPFSCEGVCTLSLAPGASQEFRLKFTPTEEKLYNDTLLINTDPILRIPLMGNGVKPEFNIKER